MKDKIINFFADMYARFSNMSKETLLNFLVSLFAYIIVFNINYCMVGGWFISTVLAAVITGVIVFAKGYFFDYKLMETLPTADMFKTGIKAVIVGIILTLPLFF